MRVPVGATEAEKTLAIEMEHAREQYERDLKLVRDQYLARSENLHSRFVERQTNAIERYHESARAELSQILDALTETLSEHENDAPSRFVTNPRTMDVMSADTFMKVAQRDVELRAPAQSSFFSQSRPIDAEFVIRADERIADDTGGWHPFRRSGGPRRPRHGA